jgi:hypothetical protein
MIRSLYARVVRLHPPYFRQRFGGEMLWTFDQAAGKRAALKLLSDGLVSLLRQWAWRQEFWVKPPAQLAGDGAPSFAIIESPKSRAGVLIHGAVLSLAAFGAISWAMAHSRSHPFARLCGPAILFSSAAFFPVQAGPPAALAGRGVAAGTDLASYTGVYVAEPDTTVLATLEGDRLQIQISGQRKSPLFRAGENRFIAAGPGDCWIEFPAQGNGLRQRMELHRGGSRITAFRR